MEIVKNKWNGKCYEIISDDNDKVVLKRCSDESFLTISKSEYAFSYKSLKKN